VAAETRTASALRERGWRERISDDLKAAGWAISAEQWVLAQVGSGIGLAVAMFLLSGGSMAAGLFGALVGAFIPALLLRHRRGKRRLQFVLDLPDVLTSMAAALQAGMSMSNALDSAADETTGAMHDEMRQVLIDFKLGDELADALSASATRMGSEDLEWVSVTLRLQAKHGGALANLLSTVAATIRERVALKRQVQTLSAEGRLSIVVLMALPFGMLAFLAVARPEYFAFFMTGFGIIILGLCGVMMLCGYLWARSIVKVEV
jgi:tight adherence protein B